MLGETRSSPVAHLTVREPRAIAPSGGARSEASLRVWQRLKRTSLRRGRVGDDPEALSCDDARVSVRIRSFVAGDADKIVALSLRAWEPVFDSLRSVLGHRLFAELRGVDWRPGQAAAVRTTLEDATVQTWVAEIDGEVGGFVSAKHEPDDKMGEIVMVAVDPEYQRRGIAAELTEAAATWIAEQGASVIMVETGGDAGHTAARATYESAGFTALPVARYFRTV